MTRPISRRIGAGLMSAAMLAGLVAVAPMSVRSHEADHGKSLAHGGDPASADKVTGHGTFDGTSIELAVGGAVQTFKVKEGTAVRLTIIADQPVAVHLHGYDIEAHADSGAPAVIVFHAVHAGRFPLVVHRDDDLLGRGETALAYVEVLPK